ncbi:MAG: glycosyltransferase 87 family protein [Sandaracinaceae bacterium]|nr:glycosyltransferase 87 family protein [Sandaracinaceae bacterium]
MGSVEHRGFGYQLCGREPAKIAIGVTAFCIVVSSIASLYRPNTWIFRDGRFYVNVATTIVEDFSLEQHRFAASWYNGQLGWNANLDKGWSNIALGRNGEYWPKHPYLLPLLASPLYYAFGLNGTILFNLLMFGVICAHLFGFARRFSNPESAAIAVGVFIFMTSIVNSAYDFSTDVLMLGLVAIGFDALVDGKGLKSGLAFGLAVLVKPTALLFIPLWALLVSSPIKSFDLWKKAIAGGACVLLPYGIANTWMFGRPWWTGYTRTLVTQGGQQAVVSHVDAFSVPFRIGLQQVLWGEYGLVWSFGVLAICVIGLSALLKKQPVLVLLSLGSAGLSVFIFSKYVYEGHRFHWPALVPLVIPLALSFDVFKNFFRRLRFASSFAVGVLVFSFLVIDSALARRPVYLRDAIEFCLQNHQLFLNAFLAGSCFGMLRSFFNRGLPLVSLSLVSVWGIDQLKEAWLNAKPTELLIPLLILTLVYFFRRFYPDRFSSVIVPILPSIMLFIGAILLIGLNKQNPLHFDLEWKPFLLTFPFFFFGIVQIIVPSGTHFSLIFYSFVLFTLSFFSFLPSSVFFAFFLPILACINAVAVDRCVRVFVKFWCKRSFVCFAALLLFLCLFGMGRRLIAQSGPFQLETEKALRDAIVFLDVPGLGEVPCDFLAWEHMNWECASFDKGTHGEVGLCVDELPQVDGSPFPSFLISTGTSGERRRVVWPSAKAGKKLILKWAIPDGRAANGWLVVRVDEREVARVFLAPAVAKGVQRLELETPWVGDRARLEFTLVGEGEQVVVAMRGRWE